MFIAPEWNEVLKCPPGVKRENAFVKDVFGLPKLEERWNSDNLNYFQFSNNCYKYYN